MLDPQVMVGALGRDGVGDLNADRLGLLEQRVGFETGVLFARAADSGRAAPRLGSSALRGG
jgi:hypothetical protein